MTISGDARSNVFEALYVMVETHDGYFNNTDEKQNFIFSFGNADDKHLCAEAIISLNINNVLVTKMDGNNLMVSM